MLRIGEFARLSQVSIVTLRYYDEKDLLKPETTDRETGYRYYSVGQLPRLNRILALKELGLSLEQIKKALDDGLTLEELQDMLLQKRTDIEQRMAEDHARLTRIDARLRQITLEETMPDYDVVLKTVPSMLVASRRVTIPTNDEVPDYLPSAFQETLSYIKAQGGNRTGPSFALWLSPADVYTNEDVEAIVPIDRELPGTERVHIYKLPETKVASVVHHGNFDDFTQGHTALLQWIEANNYRIAGPYREIYIECTPEDSTTEIQFPVKKR